MLYIMGDNLILLTAAITPDVAFGSLLSDPAERLRQYRSAVGVWLRAAEKSGCDLIVVETTGSGDLLRDDVKVLDCIPSDNARGRGKGAVEADAIDAAVSDCGLSDGSTVHKVTGRLTVLNSTNLIVPVERGARLRRTLDRSYCDTRFFSVTAGLWTQYLSGMGQEVNDHQGRYLEHVMAHRVAAAEYAGETIQRFPERPMVLGASGTTGKSYGTLKQQLLSPILLRAESLIESRLRSKQV